MTLYRDWFYRNRHDNTLHAAETILSVVEDTFPGIRSAVDLGCGVGTWLSVLKKRGALDICGVEGEWVPEEHLTIAPNEFLVADFSVCTELPVHRTFDLAISLEVAEHLPPESAAGFVKLLTDLSDMVLFSAAIPFQGGTCHLNERWTDFWIGLFEERGYAAIDLVRKRVWNDEAIQYFYRQNTLLYVKREKLKELGLEHLPCDHIPPEIYLLSFKNAVVAPRIKQSFSALTQGLRRRLQKAFLRQTPT